MKVGDKVVCIDDSGFYCEPGIQYPVKGNIYTIRGFKESGALLLVEIVNEHRHYIDGFLEKGFYPFRFRPIDYTFGQSVLEQLEEEFNREPALA